MTTADHSNAAERDLVGSETTVYTAAHFTIL